MSNNKSPVVDVIKKAGPAVVSITVTKDLPKFERMYSPQEEMFGPFGQPTPQYRQKGHQKVKVGGGSGFFVSEDGTILTNRHVLVAPDVEYTIVTNDEKSYPAEIIARDPVNDVAIIRPKNLKGDEKFPTLKLGDSDGVDLGEDVIAIGNALGTFQNTVSTGVVSGLSRFITAQDGISGQATSLRGLIQTDAAINPGNSGGPLLNHKGEVIGINTAVVMGAQNIGFAIPINNSKKDLDDFKKHGRIVQPFLGVRYILINKAVQEEFARRFRINLPVDHGALILREPGSGDPAVIPNSPADKAGIREHDIILEFDNTKIDEKHPLQALIYKHKPGEEVPIKLLRGDKIGTTSITLEERK